MPDQDVKVTIDDPAAWKDLAVTLIAILYNVIEGKGGVIEVKRDKINDLKIQLRQGDIGVGVDSLFDAEGDELGTMHVVAIDYGGAGYN